MTRTSAVLLLMAGLLGGCSVPTGSVSDQVLATAKANWAANGPASYSYEIQRLCTCSDVSPDVDIQVVVENKVVVSRSYVSSGDPLEAQYASFYPNVEGLFDVIDQAKASKAAILSFAFDPTYSFPTSIQIDFTIGSGNDQYIYTIGGFVATP